MSKLQEWIRASSTDEKEIAIEIAKTSLATFYQIGNGHRKPSAAFAGRLENGIAKANRYNPTLPTVLRGDLCEACGQCPYHPKPPEDGGSV
jgi:hypothetical protein